MTIDTHALMRAEINLINRLLAAHSVQAKTEWDRTRCIQSGFISYGLAMATGERMAKIEAITRELSNALTEKRCRLTGKRQRVPARLSDYPPSIEVPHPDPRPLIGYFGPMRSMPLHTMLLGKSYINGPQNERVSFDDAPHALIVGITGAGKSILQQMMLLSLCYATSPVDLRIVLIDLKNEDMTPFVRLPHVERFAGTPAAALDAIRAVRDEKDRRVADPTRKPYRLLLWIDELAQLAQEKEAREALGDLASIGRSKWINLVAATQYPTVEGGMGPLMKANFPLRLVGMVAPGQAHIATGRPQTGADLLPGRGAFLRCHGPEVYRLQAYYVEREAVPGLVGMISDEWAKKLKKTGEQTGEQGGEITGENDKPDSTTSENETSVFTGESHCLFPLGEGRPLRTVEAQALRRMAEAGEFDFRGQVSLNRAVAFAYGIKNLERLAWVREALSSIEQEVEV